MMVDDDDVALHRLSPHLGDEASVELAALLSGAGISPRIELRPEHTSFRQLGKLGAVAGARRLFPYGNCPILLNLLQSTQHWLIGQVVQFLTAQIIVAPLHVTNRKLLPVVIPRSARSLL